MDIIGHSYNLMLKHFSNRWSTHLETTAEDYWDQLSFLFRAVAHVGTWDTVAPSHLPGHTIVLYFPAVPCCHPGASQSEKQNKTKQANPPQKQLSIFWFCFLKMLATDKSSLHQAFEGQSSIPNFIPNIWPGHKDQACRLWVSGPSSAQWSHQTG